MIQPPKINPIGAPRKPRPHIWVYPNDAEKNRKHLAWSRAKAQAKFRNEEFKITEPEWMNEIWPEHLWARRGRKGDQLCLIRVDNRQEWSKKNTYIVTRRTQLVLQKDRNYDVDMIEIEPGVWDIVGEALQRYERNQITMNKYKGRYK